MSIIDRKKIIALCFLMLPFLLSEQMVFAGQKDDVDDELLTVPIDLEDYVLQYGGVDTLSYTTSYEKEETLDGSSPGEVNDDLYDALSKFNTSVDVSDYGYTVDDIRSAAISVLNDNPKFFYVEGISAKCERDSGKVKEVTVDYESDAVEMSIEY